MCILHAEPFQERCDVGFLTETDFLVGLLPAGFGADFDAEKLLCRTEIGDLVLLCQPPLISFAMVAAVPGYAIDMSST